MSSALDALQSAGVLSPLDVALARTLGRLAGEARDAVLLATALVSRAVRQGHVCLDLARQAREGAPLDDAGAPVAGAALPPLADWAGALRSSPLTAPADLAAPPAPLVLDAAARLYLRRYWLHQETLADAIGARATAEVDGVDDRLLADGLTRLFGPAGAAATPDRQRLAAATAVMRRFCVISGGPGTGKTHTVVRILALAVEQALAAGLAPPRILLMAPTGKAAARLHESVRAGAAALPVEVPGRAAIPSQATTIHRALGATRNRPQPFRHHRDHPLRADLVVVDEASMVDLALMARLFDALPPAARVVLLGDQDQLASVEAGAVLGDICNSGASRAVSAHFARRLAAVTGEPVGQGEVAPTAGGIWDDIVQLDRSYRFAAGICRLAAAINAGDRAAVWAALDGGAEVDWQAPGTDGGLAPASERLVLDGFAAYAAARAPRDRLQALERFRVLCAHRHGPGGVTALNAQIERLLAAREVIRPEGEQYVGRPILITRNDYQLRLFNGDVGIIAAVPGERSRREAVFVAPDGSERRLSPSRLPPHETVFAMSVHKSQGSEFDAVAVVLPPEPSPVVSRELLYTAVTRARRAASIVAPRAVVDPAVAHAIARASGLRERLWGRAP
ncbi:MAG: exodeoxyribonuclease V subunit alpha [Candidatus Binatia bacterium]